MIFFNFWDWQRSVTQMDTNKSRFGDVTGSSSVRIYFVPAGRSKEDSKNALLSKAYEAMTEANLTPEWTDESFCSAFKTRPRNSVFVLASFDGKAFDKLRELRCCIVGAGLVINCMLEGKPMPKTSHPIFSDCMQGIVACCSNIEQPERERIREQIVSMNGRVEGSLSSDCTLLVTAEVGSPKYKAAVKTKTIAIVTPRLIDEVWERSHVDVFKVKDEKELLMRFKCPIFAGLSITVSNLKEAVRKDVETLVAKNGGKFMGDMKQGETTHLVTDTMEGKKYKSARTWTKWPVTIVRSAWLFDSVSKGHCMDETDYLTDGADSSQKRGIDGNCGRRQKCSTPRGDESAGPGRDLRLNASGMTTIAPDAPNMTVLSDVSLPATSYVDATTTSAACDTFKRPAARSTLEENADAEPSTSAAAEKKSQLPATDVTAAKRFRSINSAVASPLPVIQVGDQTGVPQEASSSTSARRPSATAATLPPAECDVVSQYIDMDGHDPNVTFRPNFDLNEAFEYVETIPCPESKPPVDESPSVTVERQLNAAAKASGDGASFYGSPSVTPFEDVRRSLAKQLQNVLGRASFKRNGSTNTFMACGGANIPSPTGSVKGNGADDVVATPGRRLPESQDTQGKPVVVEWEDPNQKQEQQKFIGILKKPTEPTQYMAIHDVEESCQILEPTASENVKRQETPSKIEVKKKEYVFQLTSVGQKLGGHITEVSNFDPRCTHLVAETPTRNEKLLAAIANGVWVLYVSYLTASEAAGRFIEEPDHEFGAPNTVAVMAKLRGEVAKLMKACALWREKLQAEPGSKAYSGWNVLLAAEKSKEDGLYRILTMGGANVTKSAAEAKEGVITHVIVDSSKKPNALILDAMKRLEATGAKCYKTDVLFAYLAGENLSGHLYM